MTDVFISYSSKDTNIAEAIRNKLEQNKLKCWIAPRDILPGEEYPAGIVRGIDQCQCMVIIFSENSNRSRHVLREVERAIGREIPVIPFKIVDTSPTDSMDYFLKVAHWLDATNSDMDSSTNKLVDTINTLLTRPVRQKDKYHQEEKTPSRKRLLWILLATVLFTLLGAYYLYFFDKAAVQTVSSTKESILKKLIQNNSVPVSSLSQENISSVLDISLNIPNREISIKAWLEPDQPLFKENENVKFKVLLSKEAYLLVYLHTMDGNSPCIYPNQYTPSSPKKIPENTPLTVGNVEEYGLTISPPFGVDVVHFIATTDKDEYDKLSLKYCLVEGMNIATPDRSKLVQEMAETKSRGLTVVAPSKQTEIEEDKLWGEAIILLNTQK